MLADEEIMSVKSMKLLVSNTTFPYSDYRFDSPTPNMNIKLLNRSNIKHQLGSIIR